MGKVHGISRVPAPRGSAPGARGAEKSTIGSSSSALPKRRRKSRARVCMDCGTPFCMSGCPVNNIIPDFNDLVYKQDWRRANRDAAFHQQFSRVHRPHLSGSVRGSMRAAHQRRPGRHQVGGARDQSTKAFEEGWVRPQPPAHKTGRKVAVVGSGPAGSLAASSSPAPGTRSRCSRKNDRIGGLLRYGIPELQDGKGADRPPGRPDDG